MNRPEVICHMVSTIDGKIVGQSFAEEGLRPYLEFYVQTKQKFETQATVYGASTEKKSLLEKTWKRLQDLLRLRMIRITSADNMHLTLSSLLTRSAKFHGNQESRTEDRGSRTQESSSLPLLKRQRNI